VNWIRAVTEAHKESEAPERFFYWSALAAMSAIVKKNIFLDRHEFKVYPNIYVFLVARSGMKKGIPVTFARNLVELSSEARVVSGRTSMPKLLQDLGKAITVPGSAGPTTKAQAIIISGELSSFLVKDPDALPILTDLYNTHEYEEKWINTLKGSGKDELKEPCITILGATNEEHFVNTVPQADVKGGFIARTFVVYSDTKPAPNSLVYKPKQLVQTSDFVPFLKELAKIKGEFKWTKETGEFFHNWYIDFDATRPDDSTGTYNRIDTGILKVAMLLSLAKNLELKMNMDALQEAKAECLNCARGARQVSMGGSSTTSSQTRIVMQALLAHPDHRLSRTQILRKYWGDVDSFTLDIVVQTLLSANIITDQHMGKEVFYKMKDEIVNEYIDYARKVKGVAP